MSGWIVIPNWDRFQHYKNRDPAWIKNYLNLLHNDAYLKLSGHQRAVLHGLWLAYASSHCQLTVDTLSLTRQLGLRVSSQQLKALNDAGFIRIRASKPLARRYQPASPEKEVEKEKDLKPLHVKRKTKKPKTAGPERITYQEWQATLQGHG